MRALINETLRHKEVNLIMPTVSKLAEAVLERLSKAYVRTYIHNDILVFSNSHKYKYYGRQ